MKINYLELINFAMALSLFWLAANKSLSWILASVFAYGSIYFAHTAYPLVSGAPLEEINVMHSLGLGSGIVSKISTLIFLLAIYSILAYRVKNFLAINKWVVCVFLTAIVLVFFGYVVNIRFGDGLQLQNIVSVLGMLSLIYLGSVLARNDCLMFQPKYEFIFFLNIILALAAGVALYEVLSGRAWSGTYYGAGVRANRASSIFFNPNLYAFWSALVYLGYSYLIQVGIGRRWHIIFGMLLAAAGLYLSGGRSAAMLLFAVLFMCAVGVRGTFPGYRWAPLILILLFFALTYSISKALLAWEFGNYSAWHSLSVLGERIASTPIDILRYVANKMPMGELGGEIGEASPQIIESIEGRFIVARSDSGFVALYADAGWFALVALLGIWFVLLNWSVRAYLVEQQPFGAYSIGVLLYCIFSGFAMRFQVFPVWLLIGVSLVPCLDFWQKVEIKHKTKTI